MDDIKIICWSHDEMKNMLNQKNISKTDNESNTRIEIRKSLTKKYADRSQKLLKTKSKFLINAISQNTNPW